MTSTNDGKYVKINETSSQKGKTYYIELYKSLEARLSGEAGLRARTEHLRAAWRQIHTLCLHSAQNTHPHLLSWLQRHTAKTVLQTEWQSPKTPNIHVIHAILEDGINHYIQECESSISSRRCHSWEAQLLQRAVWFKSVLGNPWGHPVLRVLLNPSGQEKPSDEEVLEWLKEERGVMFVCRVRQLSSSRAVADLALLLASAVMDRTRAQQGEKAEDEATEAVPLKEGSFGDLLTKEAGFTVDVWELLTDIEFVLLHKIDRRDRCIELAKQTPLNGAYQLVERLQSRMTTSTKEKKLWKNAKEVAILIAQVVIARCMVIPSCTGVVRTTLYCMSRSLARLLGWARLGGVSAALARPAATARHLHTLATALHAQLRHTCPDSDDCYEEHVKTCGGEKQSFVCELYVRAITAGMNELERLKLKTEKEAEARSLEQTLSGWFSQLGSVLSSARIKCECVLTAFSVHPSQAMYDRIDKLPLVDSAQEQAQEQQIATSEFGSWANDSRSQTNFVKTSETLNIKQTHQANVLSTAILNEGEALGLAPELCQDLAVLLSGPRIKTLSWEMNREELLANCRTYMERTSAGTRALTTELKYLNLDPKSYQHLPEEEEDADDMYYGIEKGYEHLVEFQDSPPAEAIWRNASDSDDNTASDGSEFSVPKRKSKKKHQKQTISSSSDEANPLSLAEIKEQKKKERPHSKERSQERMKNTKTAQSKERSQSKEKQDKNTKETKKDNSQSKERKKEKKKEKRVRKKKEKEMPRTPVAYSSSLSQLIGAKVSNNMDGLQTSPIYLNELPLSVPQPGPSHDPLSHQTFDSGFNQAFLAHLKGEKPKPPTTNQPKAKKPKTKAKVVNIASSSPVTQNYSPKPKCDSPAPSTPSPTPSLRQLQESAILQTSNKPISEEVKKSITRLIEFRRPKTSPPKPNVAPASLVTNAARLEALQAQMRFLMNYQESPDKKEAKPVKNEPIAGTSLQETETTNTQTPDNKNSQHFFDEFIKSLKSTGYTMKQDPPKPTPVKKEMKPMSKVPPIKPVSSPASSSSAQCAKPAIQKKVDNAPHTFARLSYMHKTKQENNKTKAVTAATKPANDQMNLEIERLMSDQKLAKLKHLQMKGYISVRNHPKSDAGIKPSEKPRINTIAPEKPNKQELVSSTTAHQSQSFSANSSAVQTSTQQSSNVSTSTSSTLSRMDQAELLMLYRQQSKLNAHRMPATQPKQETAVSQNVNTMSYGSHGPVKPTTSLFGAQIANSKVALVQNPKPSLAQDSTKAVTHSPAVQVAKPTPNVKRPVPDAPSVIKTKTSESQRGVTRKNHVVTNSVENIVTTGQSSKCKTKEESTKSTKTTKSKKIENKKPENWESVLDQLLAHKTPENRETSWGPNALDMALKKDTFKKQDTTFPSKTPSSASTKQSAAKDNIPKGVSSHTKTSTQIQYPVNVQPPKSSKPVAMATAPDTGFVNQLSKNEDPFISGIPNSDYDLLEELMDDDLRQEIGELSSDEDRYVQAQLPQPVTKQNPPLSVKRSTDCRSYTTITKDNAQVLTKTVTQKPTKNETINVPKSNDFAKVVNVKTNASTQQTNNISTSQTNLQNNNYNIPSSANIVLATVPQQPVAVQQPVQNMFVIGNDLIYNPFSPIPVQQTNASYIVPSSYVAVNNTQNVNVPYYQTEQIIATPVVNPTVVIQQTVPMPVQTNMTSYRPVQQNIGVIANNHSKPKTYSNISSTQSSNASGMPTPRDLISAIMKDNAMPVNKRKKRSPILQKEKKKPVIITKTVIKTQKTTAKPDNIATETNKIEIEMEKPPPKTVSKIQIMENKCVREADSVKSDDMRKKDDNRINNNNRLNSLFNCQQEKTITNLNNLIEVKADIVNNKPEDNFNTDLKLNSELLSIKNERKVLSEVQEKLTNPIIDTVDLKTTTEIQKNKPCSEITNTDAVKNKERIKLKRLAIMNRQVWLKPSHPCIALDYAPLIITKKSIESTVEVANKCEDSDTITYALTPDSQDDVENKVKGVLPVIEKATTSTCRRILLRSSNTIKENDLDKTTSVKVKKTRITKNKPKDVKTPPHSDNKKSSKTLKEMQFSEQNISEIVEKISAMPGIDIKQQSAINCDKNGNKDTPKVSIPNKSPCPPEEVNTQCIEASDSNTKENNIALEPIPEEICIPIILDSPKQSKNLENLTAIESQKKVISRLRNKILSEVKYAEESKQTTTQLGGSVIIPIDDSDDSAVEIDYKDNEKATSKDLAKINQLQINLQKNYSVKTNTEEIVITNQNQTMKSNVTKQKTAPKQYKSNQNNKKIVLSNNQEIHVQEISSSASSNSKCVRIKLPNGKSYKATLSGNIDVDFNMVLDLPIVKDFMHSTVKGTKEKSITLKQFIPQKPKHLSSFRVVDTVDLLSDEEESNQFVTTEFGNFKVKKLIIADYEKLQEKLLQKCVVKINRCTLKTLNSPKVNDVVELNSDSEPPTDILKSTGVVDLLKNKAQSIANPEIIEIDDSSTDDEAKTTSSKLVELKNMLLSDLKLNKSTETTPPKQETESAPKMYECYVKVVRCDEKVDRLDILNHETVETNNSKESTKFDCEEDSSRPSSRGSCSILNDVPVLSPEIQHNNEQNAISTFGRTSPVLEVYEMISSLSYVPEIMQKNYSLQKEIIPIDSYCVYFTTKKLCSIYQKSNLLNVIKNTLDECVTVKKIDSCLLVPPSLISIITRFINSEESLALFHISHMKRKLPSPINPTKVLRRQIISTQNVNDLESNCLKTINEKSSLQDENQSADTEVKIPTMKANCQTEHKNDLKCNQDKAIKSEVPEPLQSVSHHLLESQDNEVSSMKSKPQSQLISTAIDHDANIETALKDSEHLELNSEKPLKLLKYVISEVTIMKADEKPHNYNTIEESISTETECSEIFTTKSVELNEHDNKEINIIDLDKIHENTNQDVIKSSDAATHMKKYLESDQQENETIVLKSDTKPQNYETSEKVKLKNKSVDTVLSVISSKKSLGLDELADETTIKKIEVNVVNTEIDKSFVEDDTNGVCHENHNTECLVPPITTNVKQNLVENSCSNDTSEFNTISDDHNYTEVTLEDADDIDLKFCNGVIKPQVAILRDGDKELVLKGVEVEDPEIGTCYYFPIEGIEENSTDELIEVVQEVIEDDDDAYLYDCTDLDDDELSVLLPKNTYSKNRSINSEKQSRRFRKRKLDMNEVKTSEKKYRKGKNIDFPKLTITAIKDSAYGTEYKRILDYISTVKFSYSSPFHKEYIDVPDLQRNWPIDQTYNDQFEEILEIENYLFDELENQSRTDPSQLSLLEEISVKNEEESYSCSEQEESNFTMGFGEGSGRVKHNSRNYRDVSKFSAATLSDVKQSQPFTIDDYKINNSRDKCKIDQFEKIQHYIKYIQLKDKVKSFFEKTALELKIMESKYKIKDLIQDDEQERIQNLLFELCEPDFIEPLPTETLVNVVQVGQLPVSAAAQNPVTCDPRVTQVSDASPPQCSIENSPRDDSQSGIKTEYTELTTADLTNLPMVQNYTEHNQIMCLESQNMPLLHHSEDIPIETEVKTENEIKEETTEENKDDEYNEVKDKIYNEVKDKIYNEIKDEKYNVDDETQKDMNNGDTNLDYSFDTNNTTMSSENVDMIFKALEKDKSNPFNELKQQNGSSEKTDQLAHAMNAAGITTEPPAETVNNTRTHLVNILSQKMQQATTPTTQSSQNNFTKTSINTIALQQALAQILPQNLNQSAENNQNAPITQQVLHLVPTKNGGGSQQSVINNQNTTPVLHIVQNKGAPIVSNSGNTNVQQTNSFSGLSLVNAGLQQGGNQLLHIVNTGNQKNNNEGQVLKRVNLVTNLTNAQGGNEQKMVQFVCKSADGKSIQLNAPHQRSMVLRLHPIETTTATTKTTENTDQNKEASQQEIKSRSMYEENYAKFIQNTSPKPQEKSNSLPKFNQAFGKPVFQEGNQKQNNNTNLPATNSNNAENSESVSSENAINMDQINQINSPPLLLRKSPAQPAQAQQNLVQQIKQTIAPMNIQTMHGGVIYTRQIPVNIGGGQTINLITVPSTELVDDQNQKTNTNQGDIEPSIIKIVPQGSTVPPNAEVTPDDSNNQNHGENTQNAQPQQPLLTQMRIKLPMLSKAPHMVSGTRMVRPSFFQIQRNVIGGTNQPVYQQLVLTAAPPLGQQTIRLPQTQTRPIKVPSESTSSSEAQMSSSTLEQLREFDMVLEQVKERSTVQPNGNSNCSFKHLLPTPSDTTDSSIPASSTPAETTQQILYSIGSNQSLNVAYVNRKTTVAATPTTSTFARSPDSSGIADSPSSSTHVQIPHTVTTESSSNEASSSQPKPAKVHTKSKSRPKPSSNPSSSVNKVNNVPQKSSASSSAQKPIEDEQTTQRILYILAEYKEQVENSPDKDKPAPRRRSNPPTNPPGSSKRKKSSSGSRRSGRDSSPGHGDESRTMGSEDSSCGTSQGDCTENCLDSHSPQDSPRKVARKLTFEQDTSANQARPQPQPQRNVIVADGQTITMARGTAGKPTTAVLMPANYILPVSMVKGGQQIAIVTNRGPKLLTVGGGEAGATNALLLQRLISSAGLKPVLARPGVRHVRLPTAALHNLQAFNLATTATTVQPPDSTASPAPAPMPPELIDTRAASSPWAERDNDVKPERGSSPEGSEPWNLPAAPENQEFNYDESARADTLDRTVLVVHKKDGSSQRHHRLTHVSAAALRHKYAILEHELRLQKSLSEECEDLGVDSPSAAELFPEAELLFAASPAQDQNTDHARAVSRPSTPVSVCVSGASSPLVAASHEEFARAHPNTTFTSEPTEQMQPFTIADLKGRHITFHSQRAPTVVMTPHTTVISQATNEHQPVKYTDIDNIINSIPTQNNINLASVLVKENEGLTRFDNLLNDRELHLTNTASAIVHSAGNATQVIRRVCYEDKDAQFLMDEPDVIMGEDTKMVAEDSSRDATLESMADVDDDRSSPERNAELFWESNSASERSGRPLDYSSDSDKCCKSPSLDETNSTDSSGVGTHMRLDSVIKEARGIERSSAESSAEDTHPPLRTYPPKRLFHSETEERSLSGKTRAGERSPDSLEVRRRASLRGVVKRGCHCCNGSPAPPRPKKSRQKKPSLDFTN